MFFSTQSLSNGQVRLDFGDVCIDESSQWFVTDFCQDLSEKSILNGDVEIWGGFGQTGGFQANSFVVPINQPFFVGVNTGLGFDGPNGTPNRDDFGWAELTVDNSGQITMLDNAVAYSLGGIVIGKNQGLAPFVPPSSTFLFRGIQINGSLSDFESSDDSVASFNPGPTLNNSEAPVSIEFFGVAPLATNFRVESNAGTPNLEHTVEAWDWATSSYDVIGTQAAPFNTDQVVEFAVVAADHIDTGGDVRSRVGWRSIGFTINFPWAVNIDQTGWTQ